jgi:hypothetical protein
MQPPDPRPADDLPPAAPADAALRLGAWARTGTAGFGLLGLASLAAAAGLGWLRGDQFAYLLHSYLVSFVFFLSLSLGALFFVLVQHATRAGWSVTCRRLAELLAANVPLLAVLFLPILLSVFARCGSLYPWAAAETAHAAHAQQTGWLEPKFFGLRALGYLAVWVLLGRFYWLRSLEQDLSGGVGPTLKMERLSPMGLLLFAGTVTFAAFDWLMSLTPHWYSTIYGVYYFAGALVGALAAVVVAAVAVQAAGRLRQQITVEHYHDLGKLLFAFVVFWGYIAFSQYLLIWYANMPEETVWYRPRHQGPWATVSLVLLGGNLLLPMLGLLSRHVKRCKPLLAFWAVWLLAMHWIDLNWLVMPALNPEGPKLLAVDICCMLGIGGVWLAGLCRLAGDRPLVPLADPRLAESLAFENT